MKSPSQQNNWRIPQDLESASFSAALDTQKTINWINFEQYRPFSRQLNPQKSALMVAT